MMIGANGHEYANDFLRMHNDGNAGTFGLPGYTFPG